MNGDPLASFDEGAIIGGKYRVEGTLGEGGMGVVVSAVHLDLERRVAIKVIRQELQSGEVAKRMLLEARHAASITNEHVVRVLDLGRLDSGAPYIVMEHLEGRNLYELVQENGPLSPLEAVDYVLEACEALAEAHSRGIVHRDLKPENLFLAARADGTPCIKVLDFGVSKFTGASAAGEGAMALTNPSVAVGSPHYMAPEQMRARADVDGRADIYSLGAILFELLTGHPPFDADNIPTLCTMVLSEPAPSMLASRSDLPPELDALIQRCLSKKPDERFWSVAELAKALLPFGSDAAQISVERVTRLLGDRPPPVSRRVPPMHERREAPTLELETPAEPTPAATASATSLPNSRSRRWIGAAALGALALVVLSLGVLAGSRGETALLERSSLGVQSAMHAMKLPSPVRVEPASAHPSAVALDDPATATVSPARASVQRPLRTSAPAPKSSAVRTDFGGRK